MLIIQMFMPLRKLKWSKVTKYIKEPKKIVLYFMNKGIFKYLPDEKYFYCTAGGRVSSNFWVGDTFDLLMYSGIKIEGEKNMVNEELRTLEVQEMEIRKAIEKEKE